MSLHDLVACRHDRAGSAQEVMVVVVAMAVAAVL